MIKIENLDIIIQYVYNSINENYENLIANENIVNIFDPETNNICKKIQQLNPKLSHHEIQLQSLTLFYMLMLITLNSEVLKE